MILNSCKKFMKESKKFDANFFINNISINILYICSLSIYITGQKHVSEAFNIFKDINFILVKTIFVVFICTTYFHNCRY